MLQESYPFIVIFIYLFKAEIYLKTEDSVLTALSSSSVLNVRHSVLEMKTER